MTKRLYRIAALIAAAAALGLSLMAPTQAQELTPSQRNTLRTAISTEPTIAAAYASRDDQAIAAWCNGASATDAWPEAAGARAMFEAMDITKFDGLAAGKRAAWDLMMRSEPIAFSKAKYRQAVVDMWGTVDSVAVLQALREKATNCQNVFGGATRTTNTVSAITRNWAGTLSLDQISALLNPQ